MAEKSEDTTTLRFINRDGSERELILKNETFNKINIPDYGSMRYLAEHYNYVNVRTALVSGRPHRVVNFHEVAVLDLDALAADLDD